MTKIAVVTGNPKSAFRTHVVALAAADALAKELPGAETHLVVDLAGYAPRLFDWADEELTSLTAQVAPRTSRSSPRLPTRPATPACSRRSSTATGTTAWPASPRCR